MADRQTGSVWTHYDGSVLTGPLAGQNVRLQIAPIFHTTWGDWQQQHPDTVVLDKYDEFANRYPAIEPGQAGLGRPFEESLLYRDPRLPESELVVGANVGSEFRAYVLSDFNALTVVQDTLADIPIVVIVEPANLYGLAFVPQVGDRLLALRVENGAIVDDQGNTWDTNGLAISGPDAGAQLPFVTSFVSEWYGWAAYHPDTTIYGR